MRLQVPNSLPIPRVQLTAALGCGQTIVHVHRSISGFLTQFTTAPSPTARCGPAQRPKTQDSFPYELRIKLFAGVLVHIEHANSQIVKILRVAILIPESIPVLLPFHY